jgi:hypothetical protein
MFRIKENNETYGEDIVLSSFVHPTGEGNSIILTVNEHMNLFIFSSFGSY